VADPPKFRAIRHRSLAAAGLGGAGGVDVALIGNTLALCAAEGRTLDVPLASIERLRLGYVENRYAGRLYRLRLWTRAAPVPLTLETIREDEAGYATITRAIAAAVERAHGWSAIEGGLGWREALSYPLGLIALFILAALAAYADPRSGGGPFMPIGLLMAGICLPILGVVMWFFFRPYRPRALGNPAKLSVFLPK